MPVAGLFPRSQHVPNYPADLMRTCESHIPPAIGELRVTADSSRQVTTAGVPNTVIQNLAKCAS